MNSVLELMGLDLPAPDHTTLSRRARTWSPPARRSNRQPLPDGPLHVLVDSTGLKIYGAGQWLEEKHSAKSHRGWRKPHLALDADSGEIIAHSLTDQETGDASQLEPLLGQIEDGIGQFTGDGACDGGPTYNAVLRHSVQAKIVIPPRSTAVARQDAEPPNQRDCHVASIPAGGRLKWHATTGYGKRALAETAMGRYKGISGRRLRARSFRAQQTEAALAVAALNRMLACARPGSVRCEAVTATSK